MKKIATAIVFLFIFLMMAPSNALCQAKNIVFNGDFEKKNTKNLPDGWITKVYRGTSAEFSVTDSEKHSGNSSYMIKVDDPGGRLLFYPKKDIRDIQPGKTYHFSTWIKAKGLGYSPNFITPAIRINYKPHRLSPVPSIDLMLEMKNEHGWKKLTMTTLAPDDAQKITVDLTLTKGTIWIDDLEIREVE